MKTYIELRKEVMEEIQQNNIHRLYEIRRGLISECPDTYFLGDDNSDDNDDIDILIKYLKCQKYREDCLLNDVVDILNIYQLILEVDILLENSIYKIKNAVFNDLKIIEKCIKILNFLKEEVNKEVIMELTTKVFYSNSTEEEISVEVLSTDNERAYIQTKFGVADIPVEWLEYNFCILEEQPECGEDEFEYILISDFSPAIKVGEKEIKKTAVEQQLTIPAQRVKACSLDRFVDSIHKVERLDKGVLKIEFGENQTLYISPNGETGPSLNKMVHVTRTYNRPSNFSIRNQPRVRINKKGQGFNIEAGSLYLAGVNWLNKQNRSYDGLVLSHKYGHGDMSVGIADCLTESAIEFSSQSWNGWLKNIHSNLNRLDTVNNNSENDASALFSFSEYEDLLFVLWYRQHSKSSLKDCSNAGWAFEKSGSTTWSWTKDGQIFKKSVPIFKIDYLRSLPCVLEEAHRYVEKYISESIKKTSVQADVAVLQLELCKKNFKERCQK